MADMFSIFLGSFIAYQWFWYTALSLASSDFDFWTFVLSLAVVFVV